MQPLRLHGTPLSHFTRKVRIVLAELDIAYEFVRIPGVLLDTPGAYASNPLMRIPALEHDGSVRFDSDLIVRSLVAQYDPADCLHVHGTSAQDLNRLAVAHGIMDNEVTLILARRGGLEDLESVAYFRKLARAIEHGLAWLDAAVSPDAPSFDYADIALVCMWQHLQHYGLVTDLARHRRIDARVAALSSRRSIATTTPAVSLADAHAAGWSPG